MPELRAITGNTRPTLSRLGIEGGQPEANRFYPKGLREEKTAKPVIDHSESSLRYEKEWEDIMTGYSGLS